MPWGANVPAHPSWDRVTRSDVFFTLVAGPAPAADDVGFWQALVVAAVSSGKNADEAVAIANAVLERQPR